MSSGNEDLLETLHRRADVLDLVQSNPRSKDEIMSELDISRSTVDRALRELETHDCVTREDDAFVTTLIGRVLFDTYDSYIDTVDGVGRATDVLGHLPRSAPLSPELLADATVLQADPPATHTPQEAIEGIVSKANRLRGLSVAMTNVRSIPLLRDRAVEGLSIEIVFSAPIMQHLRTDFGEALHEATTDGHLEMYETTTLPFGMFIGDMGEETRVAVVVYGPRSELVGVILNDRPEAVTWATKLYRKYRQNATPVQLD